MVLVKEEKDSKERQIRVDKCVRSCERQHKTGSS